MMEQLILLAAKSLLVASGTLLLLGLARKRSAADRSLIAHLGLLALVLLPIATFALPAFEVAGPAYLVPEPAADASMAVAVNPAPEVASTTATFPGETDVSGATPIDWGFWGYAVPAALLLLLTLIAVARLAVLKSRSNVLVDPHWLSALALAQRRMGFKNGTALLTSDELKSPISWGLMRPVILLNSEAVEARGEAEAIIAHELAHVTRLDWAKLLLARVAVAIFWFNPLVWLLAREAHQLREEAADDAVLASDIADTDYAQLLVGIARHECRGLLIGAHGVAPSRNSLARRVKRVLDSATARAPGGWRWSSAAAFFAAGMAVPVAAMQFVNPTIAAAESEGKFVHKGVAIAAPVASSVSTSATPVTNVASPAVDVPGDVIMQQPDGASITRSHGRTVLRAPHGGTITIYPPDARGRRRTVMHHPSGGVITYADASAVPGLSAATAIADVGGSGPIDRAIELKAVGASPAYAAAIRRAAPHLRLGHDDIVELAAVKVSPDYVRDLAGSGYPRLSADDIVEAKAMGITGAYIRGMAAAGYPRLSMDSLVELKAVGVTPAEVARFRRAGRGPPSVDRLVELKALGIDPDEIEPDDSR